MPTEKYNVTGMGVYTPAARSAEALFQNLKEAQIDYSRIDDHPASAFLGPIVASLFSEEQLKACYEQHLACVDEERLIPLKKLKSRVPALAMPLLSSCWEAYHQAQVGERFSPERVGVVVAGSNLMTMEIYQQNSLLVNKKRVSPSHLVNWLDTSHVGLINAFYHCNGISMSVGGASASGNLALIQAQLLLQSEQLDCVLVCAPPMPLSPAEMHVFKKIGVLGGGAYLEQPRQASRPFDRAREGFIYAQGAGCMVLERKERSNASYALAHMHPGGVYMDGTIEPHPCAHGQESAMRAAIANADGIQTEDIVYVSAHATSSIIGDDTELEAIERVFPRGALPYVNALKGYFGHFLTGAGLIECIAVVLQMKHDCIVPNVHCPNPCSDSPKLLQETKHMVIKHALNNSFGFAGFNTSLVLSRPENEEVSETE